MPHKAEVWYVKTMFLSAWHHPLLSHLNLIHPSLRKMKEEAF